MNKKIICLLMLIGLTTNLSSSMAISPINNLNMNSVRQVVSISSPQDIIDIKNKLSDSNIEILNSSQAVVYSNKLSDNELNSKLTKINGLRNMRKPVRIGLPPVKIGLPPVRRQDPDLQNDTGNKNTNTSLKDLEWDLQSVEADKAWSFVNQVRQVKVAVIDTGVDYTHPALKGKIDTSNGYNFVNNTTDAMDDNGHGTHLSGIITTNTTVSSSSTTTGLLGIVGNLDVKIIPVKVLDSSGSGDSDIIAKGIKWAADKGADVINLSLGMKGTIPEIDYAIQYATDKGTLVVVAAGNDNVDCSNYSPASNSNVYTVSALSKNDRKASYSNYGTKVEVSAPGDNILSTVPNGKYAYMSGTSMAAPIVSAVAAMIKAENPNLTPSEIKQILDQSAKDLGTTGRDIYYGFGKVNAYNAVKLVSNNSSN
ncbi:S8 family peptidase [Clostridium magnum]|uniref:Thermophilic serine proteinase n=1 Tax=Clostridium magnum DSM 2767 TaxID=1121326 RepID=A0A162TBQ6_9CLOT|nr:S8 family peptidase [Clostridium magnum]KZL92441.1 thermophilic serine proteinase precursor [Clostridium magnum DSM 2767]SHI26745.1 Subtilase family protein [Clostridium magnum DSM 2767]